MTLRAVMVGSLVVGLVLMLGFESPVTLTLGVLALFTFVACGLVLIAGPGSPMLQEDAEEHA